MHSQIFFSSSHLELERLWGGPLDGQFANINSPEPRVLGETKISHLGNEILTQENVTCSQISVELQLTNGKRSR
jgi:hypothetical protein